MAHEVAGRLEASGRTFRWFDRRKRDGGKVRT